MGERIKQGMMTLPATVFPHECPAGSLAGSLAQSRGEKGVAGITFDLADTARKMLTAKEFVGKIVLTI